MATAKKVRKPSRAEKMREHFRKFPTATATEVAKRFGTTYQIAYMTKKGMDEKARKEAQKRIYEITKGRNRLEAANKFADAQHTPELLPAPPITMEEPAADPVNHPAHYKVGGVETIDFIEAKGLTYHLGNAVKYISRADHKGNRKQDLEKAKWYLERAIAQA